MTDSEQSLGKKLFDSLTKPPQLYFPFVLVGTRVHPSTPPSIPEVPPRTRKPRSKSALGMIRTPPQNKKLLAIELQKDEELEVIKSATKQPIDDSVKVQKPISFDLSSIVTEEVVVAPPKPSGIGQDSLVQAVLDTKDPAQLQDALVADPNSELETQDN